MRQAMLAATSSCLAPLKAEERASTPDTDLTLRALDAPFGKLIEDRPRNPAFKTKSPFHTGPNCHIGTKIIAVRGTPHDKLVAGPQNDVVIDIASQPDHLILAIALKFSGNDNERSIIHIDAPAFNRRDKPVAAIRLAPQHTRKKLHQRRTPDEPTFMIPASISGDSDIEFLRCGPAHITQHISAVTMRGGGLLFALSGGLPGSSPVFGLPVHSRSLA
jgi:hypothetical protein